MPDYQQGKIYLIWSPTSMDVYIGSTCKKLNRRLDGHKRDISSIASKQILVLGNAEIELIELYPCNSRRELEERERWYIENVLYCINKRVPARNGRESYKVWYEKNKHKLDRKEYMKAYYDKNKLTLS